MKILFEKDRNDPDLVTVHTDKQVDFSGFIAGGTSAPEGTALDAGYFAHRIALISGVEGVAFRRYSLVIRKGRYYRWSSITPDVITIMKRMCEVAYQDDKTEVEGDDGLDA